MFGVETPESREAHKWDLAMMPYRFESTRTLLEADMAPLALAVCRFQVCCCGSWIVRVAERSLARSLTA